MPARGLYKILVVSKHLNLGGAERLLVDALPYLDRQRFDYSFAYLLSGGNFLVPQFEALGFPVHCLGMPSNSGFPLTVLELSRLQRRFGFDLVHAHLPLPGIATRIVARRHGIPVVYTEHNLQERLHPLTRWANRVTLDWNAIVFAVSQEVANSIEGVGLRKKARILTLLNGVPVEAIRAEASNLDGLRQELGIPDGHLVVGTVAVFSGKKRLQDWLEVARRIADQRKDVTFVLAGAGPEEASLKASVAAMGLADRIRMPGFRPDGRRVLALLDVYLMTSEYEGLPIALLEAMALGRPVVVTAVGGIPEVVQNGKEGFLTPVAAVDELAQCSIQLLDNPALRLEMGQRGVQRVDKEFHLRTRVQFVEDTYLRILRHHTLEAYA